MTMPSGDSPETGPAARRSRRPAKGTAESELMTSIVDSSDEAIFSETLDGVITTWNKAAERLYGYRAEEIVGQPASLLIPPGGADEMAGILGRIRSGERVDNYETTRLRKNGTTIAISLTVSPVHDAAGGIAGASSIAHNITESDRARDQARFAAQYARSLMEASLDPLVTISPEGKITDLNEAAIRMIGTEREQLIGTDFSDYFTEPERAREGFRRIVAHGFVADYPLILRRTGGDQVQVLFTAPVYLDTASNVLGVLAAADDVTYAKRQPREFSETKAFLDNILQSATRYSIIGMDLDHRILSWNEGARRNYGYAAEEVLGRTRTSSTYQKTWSLVPSTACWPPHVRMAWPRVSSSESGRTAPGSPPASS